jgi:hypothetical protein
MPKVEMPLLKLTAGAVVSQFGGEYAARALTDERDTEALPVIIPAYSDTESPSSLILTLGSLARASFLGDRAIRPFVVINGPNYGHVEQICEDFRLPEAQTVYSQERGQVAAVKAGVHTLLHGQEYHGAFATIDDDVYVPTDWANAVVAHTLVDGQEAVSGCAIRYYVTPNLEISKSVLWFRNTANAVAEVRARRAGKVRAHGANQWFSANSDGKVMSIFRDAKIESGYGNDREILRTMADGGVNVLPMSTSRSSTVSTIGDRTKSLKDLFTTATGHGTKRYTDDSSWQ